MASLKSPSPEDTSPKSDVAPAKTQNAGVRSASDRVRPDTNWGEAVGAGVAAGSRMNRTTAGVTTNARPSATCVHANRQPPVCTEAPIAMNAIAKKTLSSTE